MQLTVAKITSIFNVDIKEFGKKVVYIGDLRLVLQYCHILMRRERIELNWLVHFVRIKFPFFLFLVMTRLFFPQQYLPNKYLLKAFAKIQYYRMSFQFVAWREFFKFFFSKENCFLQTLKELYVHFPLSIINLFWRNIWQFRVQKFKISESIQCELTSLRNDKKWSNLNISLF